MKSLREALEEYLRVRRALGFKLRDFGTRLEKFVSFMESQAAPFITTKLAVEWAKSDPNVQPAIWATNLSAVRMFAEYHSGTECRTEIPSPGILPFRFQRKQPHIYTPDEVCKLMDAASRLTPIGGLRPRTYTTLFGLLATTGLRIGEALRLHRDSLDLKRGLLEVRHTKFNKTRWVPVSDSTIESLENYARLRDRFHRVPRTPWFFVAPRGGDIHMRLLKVTFIELSRQIGLRGATEHHGPRLHDFRHSFAVQTLLRWYRAGEDVECKLPLLSTYLGHSHPSDTYWYLTATPELLAEATFRLEEHVRGGRREV